MFPLAKLALEAEALGDLEARDDARPSAPVAFSPCFFV
jgi:hypothetical protein